MAINEHQAMMLYCRYNDIQAQQIIMALVEKQMIFKVKLVEELPGEVAAQMIYPQLPALADRDLILFDIDIILTYLEERLPAPALMPIMPIDRAKRRLAMYQIRHEWTKAFQFLWHAKYQVKSSKKENKNEILQIKQNLFDQLTANSIIFTEYDYFLEDHFNLCDCYFAPILLQLHEIDLELPKSAQKNYAAYHEKMLTRANWIEALQIIRSSK